MSLNEHYCVHVLRFLFIHVLYNTGIEKKKKKKIQCHGRVIVAGNDAQKLKHKTVTCRD